MTAWFVATGLFAVLDWVAVARERKPLEYLAKPATLACLIGAALTLDPGSSTERTWVVAALVFSLAGDVFLMLPRDLFIAGLASFLIGHLAYIVGLNTVPRNVGWLIGGAVAVAIALATIGRRVFASVAKDHKPMLAPVVAYMGAISAMVVSAFGTGRPLAMAGAALFYASDAMIAEREFVAPKPWLPVAIIVTYHLGQVLLVLSII